MTAAPVPDPWFRIESRALGEATVHMKPGVRDYPDLPAVLTVFAGRLPDGLTGQVLDASGTAGMAAALVTSDEGRRVAILESSAAALACAELTHAAGTDQVPLPAVGRPPFAGAGVAAGLPWDVEPAGFGAVLLAPAGDRGNARVEAEIRAAARGLTPDGVLLLALHKDAGAKRYEKLAAGLLAEIEVVARSGGWRLSVGRRPVGHRGVGPPGRHDAGPAGHGGAALEGHRGAGPVDAAHEPDAVVADARITAGRLSESVAFEAAGLPLVAVKGTYAAGKLDPGTAVLLRALGDGDWLAGTNVLDLGCGYGMISLVAARAGATVTAVDDDLGAVRSTAANATALGLSGRITAVHSDIDSALGWTGGSGVARSGSAAVPAHGTFDFVLMNPPFHVGRGVRLDLPRAFLRAALRRLRPGGELWLVANRALPYERELAGFRRHELLRDEAGFKVIRAVR